LYPLEWSPAQESSLSTPSPALVSVDWGTSAFRARLAAADGAILGAVEAEAGATGLASGAHEAFLEAQIGDWLRRFPGLPIVMSGMVGSRQGWIESPYVACPAGAAEIAAAMTAISTRIGRVVVVPGLSARDQRDAPDVMRGEETQVMGALALLGLDDATLVLPGTHSKWVTVQAGRITGFATHMTGECYALLRQHSILARTLPAGDTAWLPEAFDRGVARAQTPGGLLHHLFAVRTLALFDRDDGPALACYLSGLLIGDELRAQALPAGQAVAAVGSLLLTARYQRALAQRGHPVHSVGAEAGWAGLLALSKTSGNVRR